MVRRHYFILPVVDDADGPDKVFIFMPIHLHPRSASNFSAFSTSSNNITEYGFLRKFRGMSRISSVDSVCLAACQDLDALFELVDDGSGNIDAEDSDVAFCIVLCRVLLFQKDAVPIVP